MTPVTGETPTPAEFAAALSSVKFANTSDTPDATARSITFKVTDNDGTDSTVLTESVAVNVINDKPIVDMNGAATGLNNAVSFTEVDGADDASAKVALVASGTNLTDVDSANLSKLEITIPTTGTGGVKTGDQLIITQSGGSDKVIDLGFTSDVTTPATNMVSFGSTTFSAILSVSSGNQL